MRRPVWSTILLAIILGNAARVLAGEEPLGPPLHGVLIPASSFGEYRAGHYHGGLDFSTGSREGEPVLAPRAGWIYRVRASGIGYGRSVYLRLDDGRTTVFGHLSRFEPRLAAFVDSAQDREGTYEVDLYPEPTVFRYGAGDTVAYSGQSGAGPPHLHAEIRTGKDASISVNPWRGGWAPADSLPPRIGGLRIAPAEAGVFVNGGLDPVVLTLGKTASTVRITGAVRLWVQCSDPVPTGGHMAPYRVTLRSGDDVVEEVVFDAVDWNWAREVSWTFYAPSARRGDDAWIALDPAPGGRQHLARTKKDWEHDLETGPHTLTVEAEDASGNSSRVLFTLIKEAPPSVIVGTVGKPSLVSRGGYLDIKLAGTRSAALRIQDERTRTENADMTRLPMTGGIVYQIGNADVSGLRNVLDGDGLIGRAIWLSGSTSSLPWKRDQDSVTVNVTDATFGARSTASYGPLWIVPRWGPKPAPSGGELEPVSGTLELEPWATPLRDDATIVFSLPGERNRRHLAVMRRDEAGWGFVGADTAGEGIAGRVGSLEALAVFRDRTAPRITIQAPGTARRPRLRASIRENGVGLVITRLRFVLDGKNVISEWDPDAGILIGHLREPVAPGLHDLAVEAVDRVGNFARTHRSFTIR